MLCPVHEVHVTGQAADTSCLHDRLMVNWQASKMVQQALSRPWQQGGATSRGEQPHATIRDSASPELKQTGMQLRSFLTKKHACSRHDHMV